MHCSVLSVNRTLTVRKGDKYTKLYLNSLKKSIFYYTSLCNPQRERKSVWKLSRLHLLDREKQHIMRIEIESRHRSWITFHVSSSSSNTCFAVLSVIASMHSGSSCSFHRRIPQPTVCLYLIASPSQITNSRLYFVVSRSQLTFKSELPAYFCLVSEGVTYFFAVILLLHRIFRAPDFF